MSAVRQSTHRRKFGNHMTVHRPPVCPHHGETNVSRCNLIIAKIAHSYYQDRVSADQYHLTVLQA